MRHMALWGRQSNEIIKIKTPPLREKNGLMLYFTNKKWQIPHRTDLRLLHSG